jgi:hypothetical protein
MNNYYYQAAGFLVEPGSGWYREEIQCKKSAGMLVANILVDNSAPVEFFLSC